LFAEKFPCDVSGAAGAELTSRVLTNERHPGEREDEAQLKSATGYLQPCKEEKGSWKGKDKEIKRKEKDGGGRSKQKQGTVGFFHGTGIFSRESD
jgi:hypothetical protein